MININDMVQLIQHPEKLNDDTLQKLEQVVETYPYFQTGRLLYLHNLYMLHSEKFGPELRKSTLYITDRRTIFNMIEGKNYEIKPQLHHQDKVEKGDNKDRTMTLIDGFLEENKKSDEKNTHHTPANIAVDYASYLMQQSDEDSKKVEEDNTELQHHELIDGFINQDVEERKKELNAEPVTEDATKEENVPELPEDNNDENYFTETLAKIYIKQHRYDKALEIIKKLYLKYPQKNVYFADQIRFLEKLIINNKQK